MRYGRLLRLSIAPGLFLAFLLLQAPAATADEFCDAAEEHWTTVETTTWQALCRGHFVVFGDLEFFSAAAELEELDPEDVRSDDRRLSAGFINDLLEAPYRETLLRRGIRIVGAWLPEGLDFSGLDLPFEFRCWGCLIREILALNVTSTKDIDLRNSYIEGDIDIINSQLGGLYLVDRAVVGGSLTATGTRFAGPVLLMRSRFVDVNFGRSHIEGNLDASEQTTMAGELEANRVEVGGWVALQGFSRFQSVSFSGARVGDGIIMGQGSRFRSVHLADTHIGGVLDIRHTAWEGAGLLDLTSVAASAMIVGDDVNELPAALALESFRMDTWRYPDPNQLGSDWFATFLGRSRGLGAYDHFASVLTSMGYTGIASDIRYARNERETQELEWYDSRWWGRQFLRYLIGYGAKPFRTIPWLIGLWLLGIYVAARHRKAQLELPGLRRGLPEVLIPAAVYSLDRLLPGLKVPARPTELSRAGEVYFAAHTLLGWICTLWLVSVLAGLVASG